MSLADPLSLTIGGTAYSFPKVFTEGDETKYMTGDGLKELVVSHDYGKRNRHLMRFNHNKLTADPFVPAQNVKVGMSSYLVIDVPPAGYDQTEQLVNTASFLTLVTASTYAVLTKLLAGES